MASERRAWLIAAPPYPRGRRAISGATCSARRCGSPATRTILLRLVEPAMIERSRRGTCQARASNCNSASFARPASAGAVTVALSTCPPSAAAATATRRSLRARGDSRIETVSPSAATLSGPSGKVLEHQVAQEPEKQNEDHRRNVDPAEIGKHTPDRPQQRLGHAPQEVPDCRDDAVVPVDDAERDEPAQHRLGDQQPYVDRDHRADEV